MEKAFIQNIATAALSAVDLVTYFPIVPVQLICKNITNTVITNMKGIRPLSLAFSDLYRNLTPDTSIISPRNI